jgi:WD40 repeat protein
VTDVLRNNRPFGRHVSPLSRRLINAFLQKFDEGTFHLACHAALPVALNVEFVHLLRINFFSDPPETLPFTSEVDFLFSPLCNEIGSELYELAPDVRDVLLRHLLEERRYGESRIREIAALLWEYNERSSPWGDRPALEKAQQLTALSFLDPRRAEEWLKAAEPALDSVTIDEREWFIAMRRELLKRVPSLQVPDPQETVGSVASKLQLEHDVPPPEFKILHTFKGHAQAVGRVAWSVDGRMLASPSADGTVRVWSLESGLVHILEGHEARVISVAWSPSDNILVSSSDDKTVKFWDTLTGTLLNTAKGHTEGVGSVAWSPDGLILASGSNDKTIRLWNKDGEPLQTLEGHLGWVTSLAWAPEGYALASSSEGEAKVRLWDKNMKISRILNHAQNVRDVAWLPSGNILATACEDGTIRFWDASKGALTAFIESESSPVNITISSDGQLLGSRCIDGTVRFWCFMTL